MAPSRRTERETRAKNTVTKAIPDILSRSPRAKHGISQADLIVDPQPNIKTPTSAVNLVVRQETVIRIESSDPLQAAARLSQHPYAVKRGAENRMVDTSTQNVAVHNMASLARPGGGFLLGANSQEEFICARTTLFASLWEGCYPLPEVGGLFTPDVLVFRDVDGIDFPKRNRFFVDVISAGVARHPDGRGRFEDEELSCSCGVSYCDRERDLMMRKMKAVLRLAQSKGTKQLILGAWGCGGLNHPVRDVAKLWRKVIAGGPRQRRPNAEQWEGIEEIVFAIPNGSHAREFRAAFEDILAPETLEDDSDSVGVGADVEQDAEMSRLIASAASLEVQIEQARSSLLRGRLREDLYFVNRELALGRAAKAARDDESAGNEDVEDGFVVDGYHGSDGEDNTFYRLDGTGSDSDSDGPRSETHEFRFGQTTSSDSQASQDEDDLLEEGNWVGYSPSPQFDPQTGWFQGSIDELSAHVSSSMKLGTSISPKSPLVRRESSATHENSGAVTGFLSRFQRTESV